MEITEKEMSDLLIKTCEDIKKNGFYEEDARFKQGLTKTLPKMIDENSPLLYRALGFIDKDGQINLFHIVNEVNHDVAKKFQDFMLNSNRQEFGFGKKVNDKNIIFNIDKIRDKIKVFSNEVKKKLF